MSERSVGSSAHAARTRSEGDASGTAACVVGEDAGAISAPDSTRASSEEPRARVAARFACCARDARFVGRAAAFFFASADFFFGFLDDGFAADFGLRAVAVFFFAAVFVAAFFGRAVVLARAVLFLRARELVVFRDFFLEAGFFDLARPAMAQT